MNKLANDYGFAEYALEFEENKEGKLYAAFYGENGRFRISYNGSLRFDGYNVWADYDMFKALTAALRYVEQLYIDYVDNH